MKESKTVPIRAAIWLMDVKGSLVIKIKLDLDNNQRIIVIKEMINGNIFNFNRLKNPPSGGF